MRVRLSAWCLPSGLLCGLAACNGDTTQVVCLTDLGGSDAGRKVQTFIQTSGALTTAAGEIDGEMSNVCRTLATDLGIPDSEILAAAGNGTAPGVSTDFVCRRVQAEIDKIIRANLGAGARLALIAGTPVCTVDNDAVLGCRQACDPATVTATRLDCAAGKLYGACMGTCMGTCTSSCAATCTGSCAGTCAGTCAGNCDGVCTGACTRQNPSGSCYGPCTGNCTGTCDGACTGACTGTCIGSCSTTCLGTCQGSCATWVQPPQCTEVQSVTMAEDCQTNCDARGRFQARCSEPPLAVASGYVGTTPQDVALQRLAMALRRSYPRFLKVGHRAGVEVKGAALAYADALASEGTTARQAGAGATACVNAALTSAARAIATIDVSVRIDLAFKASLSASGAIPP